ncbi:MAG: hypothetical protein RL516_44 [Bacteroidota bacterium]|jgi:hypothetical protein
MRKLTLFIFCCVFISCKSPKYEFVIHYSKTIEDYTVVSVESIKMMHQDTLEAMRRFKKTANYKKYSLESDSIWIDSYLIKK